MFASCSNSKPTGVRPLFGRWLWLLIAVAVCALESGCVRRRMTIRSNPPGALVYVDDYEIGATPVSHDFTYYGTRKIRLVKDGYETLTLMQSIPPPWYQVPPLDFVSENLVPSEIRDHRTLQYQLTPQMIVPTEQLLQRAEGLRRGIQPAAAMETLPASGAAEPIPTPRGFGGQPVYPLSPGAVGSRQ